MKNQKLLAKNRNKYIIGLIILLAIIILGVSNCISRSVSSIPVTKQSKEDTPLTLSPVAHTTNNIYPSKLGTVQLLKYKYIIVHEYDYHSDPPANVYYTLLSDVHTWMYIQTGQTTWLEFNLDGTYQIKPSEENTETCDVQSNKSVSLVGVTCREAGEYTLKFSLVNEEQQLTYPLVLQFISVPELSSPPAAIPPELTIEEHELAQHPDTDPLFFKPVTGNSNTILTKHEIARGQPVEGTRSILLANGQLIQSEEIPIATGPYNPIPVNEITISQNGQEIFAIQAPVSPISAFRGLWSIDNYWFAEIAVTENDSFRSFTKGDIFKDGISLNETFGYTESFGFQLLQGNPFYFFEKFGRVGVSYNGQDIALGYDHVPHHGCCSVGELNPKMYENMVGFFAVRGDKWYYVEIGVYE